MAARRILPILACLVGQGVAQAAQPISHETALQRLILAQTEEFSHAGKTGDRAALDRLLDPDVVFMNEDGSMPSRQDILDGATPAPGKFTLTVTDFKLKPQGIVATATFVDVLEEEVHGLRLRTDFHSTEVWKERDGKWRMIASQTTVVPREPAPVAVPARVRDEYVGRYQLGTDVSVDIVREGDTLTTSTNGGPRHKVLAEYRDVLFLEGVNATRRYVQRDRAGRVTGYVVNLNGNDLLFRKL